MKIIEIPKPVTVTLKAKDGSDVHTEGVFCDWAVNIIDFYTEVKTLKQVRQVQVIVEALESANGSVSLENADYDLLKAAVENYPTKFPPTVIRQHLSFIDAIEKAQDVKK